MAIRAGVRRRTGAWSLLLAGLLGQAPSDALAAASSMQLQLGAPQVVNGVETVTVVVTLRDARGLPVTTGDVVLDISPPMFMHSLAHEVLRLTVPHVGAGRYQLRVGSREGGPMRVEATERLSLVTGSGVARFSVPAVAPLAGPADPPIVALDTASDAKGYFDALDEAFYPPILADRIAKEADPAKKAVLEQQLKDVETIMDTVGLDIDIETKLAAGGTPTAAERAALAKSMADNKAAFQRNSDVQEALLKRFFGDPIDLAKYQEATELFNNFKLVAGFDEAIRRIAAEPPPPGKVVERGPDASIAHIRWAKFARIAIELQLTNAALWRQLLPILAKGSAITVAVLSDNDATKPGLQPAMQTDAQVKAQRDIYDPLKPKDTDSDAEKKRKLDEVIKKLEELIKAISVDRKVLAQLPGRDGNLVLVASLASASCLQGGAAALASTVHAPVALDLSGGTLFSVGTDAQGHSFALNGSLAGSLARFAVMGHGLSPGIGPAINAFEGTLLQDRISGNWTGQAEGLLAGQFNRCTWRGSFTLAPRARCDISGDGQVDRRDIDLIFAGRGIPAPQSDWRDVDGDGLVTVNDARVCVLSCSAPSCAPR
jgi:hypothetical protein